MTSTIFFTALTATVILVMAAVLFAVFLFSLVSGPFVKSIPLVQQVLLQYGPYRLDARALHGAFEVYYQKCMKEERYEELPLVLSVLSELGLGQMVPRSLEQFNIEIKRDYSYKLRFESGITPYPSHRYIVHGLVREAQTEKQKA
jgi:hypothetical protein